MGDGKVVIAEKPTTNGCTGVPDWEPEVKACCDQHDLDYQQGGGAWQRFKSDWKLMRCIQCKSKLAFRFVLGLVYFVGVRRLGPLFFEYRFPKEQT